MSPPPKEHSAAQTSEEECGGGGGGGGGATSLSSPTTLKRPLAPKAANSPSKKQTKWTPEEDALIIELRGRGEKWEEISKRLPGRSALSCRLHYQNYLERRPEWNEEKKDRLARLYERFKSEMWQMVAKEMEIPWRAAEAMHWQMGEVEMARRAGVVPFSQSSVAIDAPRRRGTVSSGSSSSAHTNTTNTTSSRPKSASPVDEAGGSRAK